MMKKGRKRAKGEKLKSKADFVPRNVKMATRKRFCPDWIFIR